MWAYKYKRFYVLEQALNFIVKKKNYVKIFIVYGKN